MSLHIIEYNLIRQQKALKLLHSLLCKEYMHLRGREQSELAGEQLGIQELIRQLAEEREELSGLIRKMAGCEMNLEQFVLQLPGEDREVFSRLLRGIKKQEDLCSGQAEKNADLALALVEQSQQLMDFLQQRIKSESGEIYSREGDWLMNRAEPALIQGRL